MSIFLEKYKQILFDLKYLGRANSFRLKILKFGKNHQKTLI